MPRSKPSLAAKLTRGGSEEDRLRVKRKTLQAVLDQCQRALELLGTTADGGDDDDEEEEEDRDSGVVLVVRRLTRQGLDDDFAC